MPKHERFRLVNLPVAPVTAWLTFVEARDRFSAGDRLFATTLRRYENERRLRVKYITIHHSQISGSGKRYALEDLVAMRVRLDAEKRTRDAWRAAKVKRLAMAEAVRQPWQPYSTLVESLGVKRGWLDRRVLAGNVRMQDGMYSRADVEAALKRDPQQVA